LELTVPWNSATNMTKARDFKPIMVLILFNMIIVHCYHCCLYCFLFLVVAVL
jgi:hypothetical protein